MAVTYNVRRDGDSGGSPAGSPATIATGVALSEHVDSTAVNGTGYHYSVQAVDGAQVSAWSAWVGPYTPASAVSLALPFTLPGTLE